MKNQSWLKTVLVCALALLLALLTPFTTITYMTVLLPPVLLGVLYAWAGIGPACVYAGGVVGLCGVLGGGALAIGGFALLVLPAAATMSMLGRKRKYAQSMALSIAFQYAGIGIALLVAFSIVRQNLADSLMQYLGEWMKGLPAGLVDPLVINMGRFGLLPSGTLDFSQDVLSEADRLRAIDLYVSALAEGLKLALPALLFTSGLLTGILNMALPMYIWARRGDERGTGRVSISEWRVPQNAAIGLPLCVAMGYILCKTQYQGAEAAFYAVEQIFMLLLKIQALGAVNRALKRNGSSRGKRVALSIAFVLAFGQITALAGAFSLYFGSQGLVTRFIRKKNKDREE